MFTETQRCRWNYGIVCKVYFRHQTSCYEGQYLITMMGRMVELATMRQLLRDSFIWRKSMLRYQPADIAFSERRTVFSRKSFKERQCPGTKLRAYFEAKYKLRVLIILRFFFPARGAKLLRTVHRHFLERLHEKKKRIVSFSAFKPVARQRKYSG